jgi:hypothetical protein
VLQRTDEAVIAYPVFPELTERTMEPFANLSWVVELFYSLIEEAENAARTRWIEFL